MALALLRKMKRQGIKGTEVLYTSAITALQRGGRYSEVSDSVCSDDVVKLAVCKLQSHSFRASIRAYCCR